MIAYERRGSCVEGSPDEVATVGLGEKRMLALADEHGNAAADTLIAEMAREVVRLGHSPKLNLIYHAVGNLPEKEWLAAVAQRTETD